MTIASLELPPRLDLRAVGTLQSEILSHRGHDLAFDAGQVEHFGALALQTIRSAAKTWAEDGFVLTFTNTPSGLLDQLGLLGFTAETVTAWRASQ